MKVLILLSLLQITTTALAQSQWQPVRSMLVARPDQQEAAARHLKIPANCLILLATLDCSDCRKPLEALRGNKSAVIMIRARASSVERWKKLKPTPARVITIDGDEADKDWFDLGAFAMPTVIKWENGRAVGVADHVPEN